MIKNYILTVLLLLTMVFATQAQMTLQYDGILASDEITLPLASTVDVTVYWGNGSSGIVNTPGNLSHIYTSGDNYTVQIKGLLTEFGIQNYPNADKLTKVSSYSDLGITSLYYAFHNASSLTQVFLLTGKKTMML